MAPHDETVHSMNIQLENINNPDNTHSFTVVAELSSVQISLDHLEDGEVLLSQLTMPSVIEPYVEDWFTIRNQSMAPMSVLFDVCTVLLT